MFKRLRNRFLVVNLVSISIMMLVAFATIYIITYQNVQRETNMELFKVSDFYHNPYNSSKMPRGDDAIAGNPPTDMQQNGPGGDPNSPPGRSVSFMVKTDNEWNITDSQSRFSMEDAFYAQALEKVDKTDHSERKTGQFALNGTNWAYVIDPSSDGHMIVFIDVTAQQGILTNLIYTFTIVGLFMLVVIYFLSRYFANRSIAPVKEAFDKQKQFIADASHELKTPLAIINTNTDVLLANRDDTIDNQSKWLHYIKSETERMSRLTSDLLYLTEIDDSRSTMIHSKFDMSDAVETIILTMEAVIFEKNISLDYSIEPELMVHGNSEQIKQVILILLDNAVKYSKAKGAVNVSLKKHNHEVVLAVSNTGEGIAPEHLDRIFDRFYRTDASRARKHGGHGLGLAIAKSIVDQHKGQIYARSVVGEGATFYVRLT
ncbi:MULTISPECIES: cell wall metabolism sensor histidine kinase WalK [Paenibacillus]|uniref:sensor histidine kinase n=1 Tax=Paenibacillus illinoisensis TaxID=59845 RepID=UPI001C8EA495|nr:MULTISPECIES: HAMP domain-containing sensor histidine kinase [Paenibacillus]MBY0217618.1 HAMP domain-containing histidine kinase [Paenibacillus illinoisensis]MCM3206674.1 HAMP domain-containing histidine kinase [Paenibacillus illinoisensis]WJH27199.1 HAMP domain-containing histidine kinase [Paenibacillus sp. CC-CFT742]